MRRYPLGKQQRSHPEHQEREFTLSNDVHVHEDILVLNGAPHKNGAVDPPAVYYTVALRNESGEEQHIATYASASYAATPPTTWPRRTTAGWGR